MYNQLYTQPAQNQVPKVQKTLKSQAFLDKYTKTAQKIAQYYIGWFPSKQEPYIKQETIAKYVGCSVRTVQRASDRFVRDSWLLRHRPNKYSPYYYDVLPTLKGKLGYEIRINSLTPIQKDYLNTTGNIKPQSYITKLSIRNVIQIRTTSNIKYNYLKNPLYIPLRVLKIGLSPKEREIRSNKVMGIRHLEHMRQHFQGGICNSQKRRRMCLLNDDEKKYILDRKDANGVREALLNEKVWDLILTEFNEKLSQLSGITEIKDRIKLVAFHEGTLQKVYHHCVNNTDLFKIADRFAYVIAKCKESANAEGKSPDYQWYFELCGILDIPTGVKKKVIPQVSHNMIYPKEEDDQWKVNVQTTSVRKLYPVFEGYSKVQTVSERSTFLETEIVKIKRNIDQAADNPFLKIMIPKFELDLQNYQTELKELRGELL